MARILILGAGAIGGAVAAALSRSGHQLWLVAAHARSSLRVEGPSGEFRGPICTLDSPQELPQLDWAMLCTKAHQIAGVREWLRALSVPLVVLQNGVEQVTRVNEQAPQLDAIPAVVDLPAHRPTPDHVVQRRTGLLLLPDSPGGRAAAALFTDPDVQARVTPAFRTAAFEKLAANVAGGALAALTGRGVNVAANPVLAEFAARLVEECVEVGRAEGALLPDDLTRTVVTNMQRAPDSARTSLLADREAGRPLEVDARNGAVVRLGRKHGIPTPDNELVAALLGAVNRH